MVHKNETDTRFSVFVMGFTTMITQIILLRFYLSVLSGNELVIGIVLSTWMLITGFGAFAGRYIDRMGYKKLIFFYAHIALAFLPIITAFLIFYLRNQLFPPGQILDIIEVFSGSLILLFPFCFITGILFTLFSTYLSRQYSSNKINSVYALGIIGAITGGLLFNFIFIFVFNPFFSLKLVLLINLMAAIVLSFRILNAFYIKAFGLIAIAVSGIFMVLNVNEIAWEKLYNNQNVVLHTNTSYGNILITETSGQYNFYQNGIFLFSNNNTITNEENVHYAMLQHPDPENVLIVSGGIPGTLKEVLKYEVKTCDYLEIDPTLVKLSGKFIKQNRPGRKVNIINQDARLYLKRIKKEYDVVLINLPDPVTTYLNRYYTLEFFEELKPKLSKSAVVCISLGASVNYLSEEAKQSHTALYSTLKLLFDNVIIIPGMRNYFLASDGLLTSAIGYLSDVKNIHNEYVNSFYLDDNLINERRWKIEQLIQQDIIINYDFFPVTFLLQLKLWMLRFNINLLLAALVLFFIIAAIIPRMNIINFGMFTTGFSAASLQLILLIAFQILYGYLYFMIGIFITIFMIGLFLGATVLHKKVLISTKNYSLVQYIFGIFTILTPIILIGLKSDQLIGFVIHSAIVALILITGVLTGIQFAQGSVLRKAGISKVASGVYGSHLLGAALGAMIVSTLLIPSFGLIKVCLILGILNFLAGLLILYKSVKR